MLLILVISITVWLVYIHRVKCRKPQYYDEGKFSAFQHKLIFWNDDTDPKNLFKQYLTPYNLPDTIKQHGVDRDCTLQDYIDNTLSHVEFSNDHLYCEFTNGVENILEDKEVLLQDKNAKTWFRLVPPEQVAAGKLKLYGEGIPRSNFGEQYKVFIQSFGSGARCLPKGSKILYNHCEKVCNWILISAIMNSIIIML